MYFDTLQYVDGSGTTQEIALSLSNLSGNGGATRLVYEPRSHRTSTFKISWATPPETDLGIPFKSRCVVYAGRTSTAGAANTFSGGTILFQGRRTDNAGSASGSRVVTEVTLSDLWWDLGRVTFRNVWSEITAGTVASPTYSTVSWPDVILFQPAPGATYSPSPVNNTISTWQQIKAVISYASGYASGTNAVQVQTTSSAEFTPLYCNWYPVRSAKCAEALTMCLRPHPGVYTEVDYTTTPPTIHFRNAAALTAVTLPYATTDGSGITHLASNIQSLDELIPDAVRLYYKINNTIAGQPIVGFGTDIYPAAAANSLLCLDYSIDITGSTSVQVENTFVSAAFDPTSKTLWRTKVNSLKQQSEGGQIPNDGTTGALTILDTTINGGTSGHPDGIQVVDDSGTAINLSTYQYYTDGDVFAWMQQPSGGGAVSVVHANVTAFFSYQKSTGGVLGVTRQETRQAHHMRLKLTNAPSGLYVYAQTVNQGESIPSNLAQSIYTELSTLQWKLKHEILQTAATADAAPTLIKPGKHCINLSGGASAWTTMNAIPETVTIEFFRNAAGLMVARHSIQCGPVNHLEPGYLVQLTNLFRNRQKLPVDANQRLTGQTCSNLADLSSETARENSVPANSDHGILPIYAADATNSGYSNVLTPDATLGHITVAQQNSSTGASVTTGLIPPVYSGTGAPASGTLATNAYYRVGWFYVDTAGNNLWRCTTAGSNSTSAWTQISSSGGGFSWSIYDNTQAYYAGNVIRVATAATFSGTTSVVGTYVCVVNVPANGTGNNVPTFPEPTSGTIHWRCLGLGFNAISTCASGGSGTIYIQSSNTLP